MYIRSQLSTSALDRSLIDNNHKNTTLLLVVSSFQRGFLRQLFQACLGILPLLLPVPLLAELLQPEVEASRVLAHEPALDSQPAWVLLPVNLFPFSFPAIFPTVFVPRWACCT